MVARQARLSIEIQNPRTGSGQIGGNRRTGHVNVNLVLSAVSIDRYIQADRLVFNMQVAAAVENVLRPRGVDVAVEYNVASRPPLKFSVTGIGSPTNCLIRSRLPSTCKNEPRYIDQ